MSSNICRFISSTYSKEKTKQTYQTKRGPVTPGIIMIKFYFPTYNTVDRTLKDLQLLTLCSFAYTSYLRYNELYNIKANH